jgi:hypothetical protein
MSTGFSVDPFVLLVLVVGLVIGIGAFMLISRKNRSRASEPACGKCGYAVRGLPTFTCPECGADLREVGIVTSGQRTMSPKARGVLLVLLWTLVLPVPAMILSAVALQATPQTSVTRWHQGLGSPDSAAYERVNLDQRLTEKGNRIVSNRLTYTLIPSQGQPTQIDVDPASRGYSYRKRSGEEVKTVSGLNENTFLDWMSQAGIDRENEQVKLEVAELLTFAQGAALGAVNNLSPRHFRSLGSSGYSRVGPSRWVLAVAATFWLGIWLLGCWKLWKIGSRR